MTRKTRHKPKPKRPVKANRRAKKQPRKGEIGARSGANYNFATL